MNDFAKRGENRGARKRGNEHMKVSNLENYFAGCNTCGFIDFPKPKQDELLNAHLRGYNLHLIG